MDIDDVIKVNDRVRIVNGRFKGETGMVIAIAEGMCYVQLDNDVRDVGVYISDCELIND